MESINKSQKNSVQETASDALLQKLYAINKGYFDDHYQKYFVNKGVELQKYLPLMNKGTFTRVRAIRNQIEYIISVNSVKNGQKTQIVNLGCGMDSLFFYLKDKFKSSIDGKLKVLELDYTEITKQKIKYINASNELKAFLVDENQNIPVSSDKKKIIGEEYVLYNCDLSNSAEIKQAFTASKLDTDAITIIISECFLCYLPKEDSKALITTLGSYLSNAAFLYYDLIHPNDEFGKVMIRNLKQYRNMVLPGYEDCPDEAAQNKRMLEGGFTEATCIDMLKYFNEIIPKEEKDVVNQLELLDELEEWNMLQKHYCIGFGIKVKEENILSNYSIK